MYARALVFLFLASCLLGGWPGAARAQTPTLPVPNQPGLSTPPPPPPPARPDSSLRARAVRATRRLVIRLETEAADQALLRRYRYRSVVPDSLAAFREVRELVLALQAASYLTASADGMRWSHDTLRVQLYVGEKFRWARLRNGNLGDGLMTRAGYREKLYNRTPFEPDEWRKLQQNILAEAENQGYPFATVRLDSLGLRGADISGRVVLDRGRVVVFDSIQLVGKTKTKKRFLTKYLQIFPNQPYNQQRVDAAARLLRQLPYLQVQAEPEVRFFQGKARLYLLLEDRPSNQFDAIVGVLPNPSPGVGQKKLQLTGDVNINLRNLSGGGKQVGLQWRKLDAASQQLAAHYVHPNFFGTPLELGGNFELYRQTNAFLTVQPRLQITYPTVRAGRISFFTERRSSRLLSDKPKSLRELDKLPDNIDSQYNSYGLDYNWNSLDDLLFPRRGFLAAGQAAVGTKRITKNADLEDSLYNRVPLQTTQVTLGLRLERYFRIGRNGVLLTRLRGESLVNERLFLNDMFRLGGLATLRGFNEYAFYANTYGIGTAEFRQFTGADSFVFLFVDQAYLRRDLLNDKTREAPTGLGAGLSFRTGAGLFQFVYSVGRSDNQRMSLSNSKIHFGIISRF
ncbi:BamA/TamA family outer membrane protein [Hymenobacter chitinivorans]|uniref:Surface antigen-like variable number repeat protein n=1 Tax=Hymenobacter chitinivorans DSM 11115 TaxID=1121954 RepID=A0A2M9B4N5_9BACT|nr:BamA/TamA family outer membrane protein [Hymenobacter chitinivorans]PJJ52922.1 surface antigen-like variable number repeat protein [Hymenobacter chitinivorans DSM 11115]